MVLCMGYMMCRYSITFIQNIDIVNCSLELLRCVLCCAQSCLTLSDPVNCSPLGSSVNGIFLARILEWVAVSYSRGSSQPRDQADSPSLVPLEEPDEHVRFY